MEFDRNSAQIISISDSDQPEIISDPILKKIQPFQKWSEKWYLVQKRPEFVRTVFIPTSST
jgi:hypothetical protein